MGSWCVVSRCLIIHNVDWQHTIYGVRHFKTACCRVERRIHLPSQSQNFSRSQRLNPVMSPNKSIKTTLSVKNARSTLLALIRRYLLAILDPHLSRITLTRLSRISVALVRRPNPFAHWDQIKWLPEQCPGLNWAGPLEHYRQINNLCAIQYDDPLRGPIRSTRHNNSLTLERRTSI